MPWTQVMPEELVIGTEYALTRKGLESRTDGANTEVVDRPSYTGAPAGNTKKVTVWKTPATVVAPPTAEKALTDGYRALQTWESKDAADAWKRSIYSSSYGRKPPRYTTFGPMEIRKKAFYAGVNAQGKLVFTQERSFGSTKPVAFVPVDVDEKVESQWVGHKSPKHNGIAEPKDWAFWTESRNNGTRRNNNGNAGVNRLAQIPALKAQHALNSNAYKALNAEEKNLIMKHLGGARRSRTKRNNRSRKNRTY